MQEYQAEYSRSREEHGVPYEGFNPITRTQKARKILAVCSDFGRRDLKNLSCLDLGCAGGFVSAFMAKYFRTVLGVDFDRHAIAFAKSQASHNCQFHVADTMNLPFAHASFDVIICNHVYEHVPDQARLAKEISRVLKPDGFCYLGAGSKYNVVEGHYRLPFLSWLPKQLAHYYLRLAGKGNYYYETHLSYGQLRRLFLDFEVHDFTVEIIKNPAKYEAQDVISKYPLVSCLPERLLNRLIFAAPGWAWILTPRSNESAH